MDHPFADNVPLATRPVSLLYMPLFPHASNVSSALAFDHENCLS
jgi:hypothetical protein